MADKAKNKVNKKQAKPGAKVDSNKSKVLKHELEDLYQNLEKYFAINFYYDSVGKNNPNWLARNLLSKLEKGHRVLELGLNPGVLSLEAALKQAFATGIDSAPMKVVIAENLKHIEYDKISLIQELDNMKLPLENLLSCKFVVANYASLNFPDNFFHVIFSYYGLENCDINQTLDEALRCLSPRGQLIALLDLTKNLSFDIVDKKKKSHSVKCNSKVLKPWLEDHNIEIINFSVTYKKGFGSFVVSLLPFLNESPLLAGFEDEITLYLQKLD